LGRFLLFRYCTKVDAKLAELMPLTHQFAKESRVRIGRKTHVLGRSRPFHCYTKVDAKLAELAPLTDKFAKHSRVGIFRYERTQSTPFHPKHMFWGISDGFVTARKLMQNWPNWCINAHVR
jgi:hypothetical protein